ncbi:MAG: ATP-dependent sacrificial sulfur transferase LarE [Bacteroidales bacterium]|nr:ATP-dependent sacrificial sulfur transferase LarE [Bacteroidales bacterium]
MTNYKNHTKAQLPEILKSKLARVKHSIKEMRRVAVAYSGGVDSTLLLDIAYSVLGNKAVAIYAESPLQPERERKEVLNFTRKLGVKLLAFEMDELKHAAFKNNPPNRCYYCKSLIFSKIKEIARENNIQFVVDGSNYDDQIDYRPGVKALREKGIRSPLQEAGLTKDEIRKISKFRNLPTWDKDALACLATRIPFGEAVTKGKLKMIDKAEEELIHKGFRNVRARFYGKTVKIEVRNDQVERFSDKTLYNEVLRSMQSIGFCNIEIDPMGYRQGSMNGRDL